MAEGQTQMDQTENQREENQGEKRPRGSFLNTPDQSGQPNPFNSPQKEQRMDFDEHQHQPASSSSSSLTNEFNQPKEKNKKEPFGEGLEEDADISLSGADPDNVSTPLPLTEEPIIDPSPPPRPLPVEVLGENGPSWFDVQFHEGPSSSVIKPKELVEKIPRPPMREGKREGILNRIQGSMLGMAIGDALGAHVEFRPREYLVTHPVTDLGSGGTWGLERGQFTDDTSMALCLALSLIAKKAFVPYDQLVRYQWWYQQGFMSSTGQCFDIGAATSQSLREFQRRQQSFAKDRQIPWDQMDQLTKEQGRKEFPVDCSEDEVAGNGALMRLAPVPLFFYLNPPFAVRSAGKSGQITHGDRKAVDSCRFYAALIIAALQGQTKDQILDDQFVSKHAEWFGEDPLHPDVLHIAKGSYKNPKGYEGGIRGKGYIVAALEAALWAFWSTKDFHSGALSAVNLGDDTDTTAAIFGQLAGAFYGYDKLPEDWVSSVYAREFLEIVSEWIEYEGEEWNERRNNAMQN